MNHKKITALLLSLSIITAPVQPAQAAALPAFEPVPTVESSIPEEQQEDISAVENEKNMDAPESGESSEAERTTDEEAAENKAEQNSDIQDNTEIKEAEEQTDIQAMTEVPEPEKPDTLSFGDYIESDLDYNTPVYDAGIATYASLPSAFPDDMNVFETTYPSNRNQNPYGTCWAVASTGLAEFDLINDSLAGRGSFDRSLDLSELQLAYFTYNSVVDPLGGTEGDYTKYYNENASVSYLNYGGNYAMAARRLAQWCGAVPESLVPYSQAAATVTGGLDSSYAYSHDVAHLENIYMVNIRENASDVKQQIMEHGAVGVMYYHADAAMGWNSALGRYTYYDSATTGGGHAVMIVGWDDDFSRDNFTAAEKPSENGAWLVRNSWGLYANYFWMSYETVSLADTAWVFDFAEQDDYDNNYQLDGGIMSYPDTSHRILANVFQAKQVADVGSETLKAVSLTFSKNAGVEYQVEIYTDLTDAADPLSGTRQEAATTTGRTTYAGTYTVSLEHTVTLKPGTAFAVVVTVDAPALDYEQAQSVASEDFSKTIWDCGVSVGNNKSFYYSGSRFYPFYWGNYCVKAFTSDEKESIDPKPEPEPVPAGVRYRAHVQDYGWLDPVQNGEIGGTTGQGLRVEAFELSTENVDGLDVHYMSMVQGKGWQEEQGNGAVSGTTGQGRQIEAVMISLGGQRADQYDIWYRVHVQDYGWLSWAADGAPAGTGESGRRIEAMQVVLLPKDEKPDNEYGGVKSDNSQSYLSESGFVPSMQYGYTLQYQAHVQNYGWLSTVPEGSVGGTTGKALRMEALKLSVYNKLYSGSVVYTTHVQDYGWLDNIYNQASWKQDGQISGTTGEGRRCEAVRIALTGELSRYYDIYYRAHAANFGWLSWASNGEPAGTAGYGYQMEAVQIVMRPKGSGAPARDYQGVTSATTAVYVAK